MPFRIDEKYFFRAPVVIHRPGGGEVEFIGGFRLLSRSAYAALQADAEVTDLELCLRLLAGWDDIEGPDGPVPFTDEAVAALLDQEPTFAHGVFAAYGRASAEAALKNYAPPAPRGHAKSTAPADEAAPAKS
ncbi:MAG: hypothetical protein KDH20_02035 [Rhodocyclaceae bacterium]|nr:hypothetical protein [Gammaproteobacteria bacterium]MCB1886362.1 hypothetical protein [Rhodocyclaceae bacterium]